MRQKNLDFLASQIAKSLVGTDFVRFPLDSAWGGSQFDNVRALRMVGLRSELFLAPFFLAGSVVCPGDSPIVFVPGSNCGGPDGPIGVDGGGTGGCRILRESRAIQSYKETIRGDFRNPKKR